MGNENSTKRMSMIVTKGSLDWTCPPFIQATTAAAMNLEVNVLHLLRAHAVEEETRPEDLHARQSGDGDADVWHAMDLFEYTRDDMIEGTVIGGAATYIETATKSDINLFI